MELIMKKIILAVAILALAIPSLGATISWQHDGVDTVGYTIYFWETASPSVVYNKSAVGASVRNMVIEDTYFKPNVAYTFTGTAYNTYGESARADEVTWQRAVEIFNPAADLLPTTVIINNPAQIVINVGQ